MSPSRRLHFLSTSTSICASASLGSGRRNPRSKISWKWVAARTFGDDGPNDRRYLKTPAASPAPSVMYWIRGVDQDMQSSMPNFGSGTGNDGVTHRTSLCPFRTHLQLPSDDE